MATWTRPLRHIMQVRAPWIEPGEFRGIAKRAITFRKSPILISGPAPIGFPHAFDAPRPIYRMVADDGRVVFTNE